MSKQIAQLRSEKKVMLATLKIRGKDHKDTLAKIASAKPEDKPKIAQEAEKKKLSACVVQ